jgi:hypothetical protein
MTAALLWLPLRADPIPARFREGTLRGFLQLTDVSGKPIATGDLIQSTRGSQMISRLVFHFRDGSLDDETTVFTQKGTFRLVHDHHVQKGPSFTHAIDVDIDMAAQQVITRTEKDGKPDVDTQHIDLPADLANGLPLILVKNILRSTPETKVAYLASMPKPRVVHLVIKPDGGKNFSVGAVHYKASCFIFHIDLGGLLGVVAPLVGKQPVDDKACVIEGPVPAFVRADVSFYDGGPVWTIEMASPQFSAR